LSDSQREEPGIPSVELADAASGAEWNHFVERHPAGTLGHLFQWRSVVERAYRGQCRYFVARSAGSIVGVLPTVAMRHPFGGARLVSMPYLDQGGLLASSSGAVAALWTRARQELAARRGALELRAPLPFRADADDTSGSTRRFRLVLDLPESGEELWSAIGGKVRNQVRKSQKEALTTARADVHELPSFYEIFARNMRDLGSPVHSYAFLAEIFAQFGDRARLYLTRGANGAAVAGAIAIGFRHTLTVPWASALRSARHACPNHSLYWQILEDAVAEGRRTFDFGRSTEGTGTFHFKQQWGATPVPLLWQTYSPQGERRAESFVDSRRLSSLVALWSKIPVPIATWLGSRIRGHLSN
jgi:FemAB-related protein (PEP-CTERM system-associated)